MSLTVIVSGTLAKAPEQRTTRTGSPYTVASMRAQTAEGDLWATITAFSEVGEVLAGMCKGDSITVIGAGRLSVYQRDGEHKPSLSVTASRIIAALNMVQSPRQRRQREVEYQPTSQREFADAIPF